MYPIVKKRELNPTVTLMEVSAPFVAKKAEPGQFIILRVDEAGERIPLTVADFDREKGTVTIIFQIVGGTTERLNHLNEGDGIHDFVGPLGEPSHTEGLKKVAVIGGGVGCAIAYPVAKALHAAGAHVDMIAGFRSKDIVILEEEMAAVSSAIAYPVAKKLHGQGAEVHSVVGFRNKDLVILEEEFRAVSDVYKLMTDDGSKGEKGLVTDALKALIEAGNAYDEVIAIGPVVMMKFVSLLTKQYGIKTVVSMNPIMIDGTGMCGCCRLSVGGKMKFACVDGPDFDGHEVDYDEILKRASTYKEFEAREREAACNLFKKEVK